MKNKTILITGASDGLGKELAIACAIQGATVLLLGRKKLKLEAVYDSIIQQNGAEPTIIPFDLSTATMQGYEELSALIKTKHHNLNALVHNATIVGPLTPIELFSPQQWYEVLQVNLHAPFHLTQFLLPILKQRPNAQIIFSIDQHFKNPKAYWGAYGVSKKAIHGFMETLAQELENTPVKVNAINPGAMNTALRAKAYPGEKTSLRQSTHSIIPHYLNLIINKNKINGKTIDLTGDSL